MTKDSTTTTPKTKSRLNTLGQKKKTLLTVVAALALIALIIIAIASPDQTPHRAETYKNISGAAGLNASVDYDCTSSCDNKFDFNVYIFNEDGRQVATARPDQNGGIRLALPEGDYVMLIGKRLSGDKVFPQEPLELKNGKELELKLHYEGEL